MRLARHSTAKIFRRGVNCMIKNKLMFMDFLETNVQYLNRLLISVTGCVGFGQSVDGSSGRLQS